jgi:hypothetical protein
VPIFIYLISGYVSNLMGHSISAKCLIGD